MPRSLLSGMVSALADDNVTALLFIQLDFDSGAVRVTNLAHDIAWNGSTWTGAGQVGSVDAMIEGDASSAQGMAFTLTGIPPAMVALTMTEQYQGRRARVWFGTIAAGALVADPVLVFSGRMDNMQVNLGNSAEIRVNAESRLVDFERPRIRRYNHEDQIAQVPGDLGLQYVAQMVEKSLYWGVANPPTGA
jgi:hypothetical protein